MYSLLYLKQMTNKDLLDHTVPCADMELCSMYVTAWIEGEFGEEWIHVYVWLSPFALHLKLSHLFISCTLNTK